MSDEQPERQRPKGGIPHDPKSLRTLLFTGKVLSLASQNISESVDSFSGWLLGGFGAVLALLFANIDKLKGFIEISALRHAGRLYFAAAILGVFAKIIGLMVTSATKGKSGASALTSVADDIDLNLYLDTAQRAFFPHTRWFLKRLLAKAVQGDFTYVDRMWMKCAQVQSLIVMVEAVLVLIAGGMIVFSI